MHSADFIVIGAGLSGLAHAWQLQRAGHSVAVLEQGDKTGGVIQSAREDGFLMDLGPNTLQVTSAEIEDWLQRAVDGHGEIIRANPSSRKRFILYRGQPEAVPMSPLGLIRTPLFSTAAKLRLLTEPFRRRGSGDDESLASFVRRRLGPGVINYGLNPFVAGVHAGDPEKLSVNLAFPRLAEWERRYGSLLRGALRSRKNQPRFKSYSVNFSDGLATLTDALSSKLTPHPICSAQINGIATANGQWQVTYTRQAQSHTVSAANLILSVPAHALHSLPLPADIASQLGAVETIAYPPVTVLGLGYRRQDVGHPLDGFGVLVPECEQQPFLGTLFTSSLFPNRAPPDQVLLTSFIGGSRQPEIAGMPAAEQIELTRPAIEKILSISGKPTFTKIKIWPRAIPQRTVGCQDKIDRLRQIEANCPGLQFVGNYSTGISLTNCIQAALAAH